MLIKYTRKDVASLQIEYNPMDTGIGAIFSESLGFSVIYDD